MKFTKPIAAAVLGAMMLVMAGSTAQATTYPYANNLINAYLLNEKSSGQLTNTSPNQFVDTAPIGTAQNHDTFNDSPSNGPQWVSGAVYSTPLPLGVIGTGTGLGFDRSDNDRTRFAPWLNTTQGNYSNGKSFTAMLRLRPSTLADNTNYDVLGTGSARFFIRLAGVSGGGTSRVDVQMQTGGPGTYWNHNSFSGVGDNVFINTNTWYNLFMIYDANSSLTIAADDGTTFKRATSFTVPGGWDSLANGFGGPALHWIVGSLTTTAGSYDGLIESIYFWDRALSLAEADAVGLTHAAPEPSTAVLLVMGGGLLMRRWRSRRS